MDTTIADFARFAAGFMRGEGLSQRSRAEMVRAQAPITTAANSRPCSPICRRAALARAWPGLGLVTFTGPQGRGFFKGGHNDSTGNIWVCLERGRRCVVLLSNDVRAEHLYRELAEMILGPTGLPWNWEYAPGGS